MYTPDGNHYRMMNGTGWMSGGGGWMIGFAVLVVVLLAVAVAGVLVNLYLHSTRTTRHPAPAPPTAQGPEARTLLDGRLARGEVTAEEYRAVRELLDAG